MVLFWGFLVGGIFSPLTRWRGAIVSISCSCFFTPCLDGLHLLCFILQLAMSSFELLTRAWFLCCYPELCKAAQQNKDCCWRMQHQDDCIPSYVFLGGGLFCFLFVCFCSRYCTESRDRAGRNDMQGRIKPRAPAAFRRTVRSLNHES